LALCSSFWTRSRMCAQLPRAIPNIKQTGNTSANRRSKEPDSKPSRIPLQQHPQDNNHLQDCSDFANHSRANFQFYNRHLDNEHSREHQNVQNNDCSSKPERNGFETWSMFEAQNDNARDKQQFIRERVQNCTQLAALVVSTCDVAIDAITDRG